MSHYLYRLGRFAFRRRKTVVGLWLALLVSFGIGAVTLAEETESSFDVPGTESMTALDLLEERFPEAGAGGAGARVVFAAPPGETLSEPGNQAAIQQTVAALQGVEEVVSVTDPFLAGGVSPDETIAYAQVTYEGQVVAHAEDNLREAAAPAVNAGLTVQFGGDALQEEFEESAAELIGLGVAALVLIITFGSFVAAGLPLLNAIVGVGVTIAAITVATRFFDLSEFTPTLAMMLGLALAIDYSLFILSRYRHELSIGREGPEAIGRAIGTAGSAVVFAGLTVIIALVGLSVVRIPLITEMGLAAAFAVAMSVLIALTMLPAMCGFLGRRIMGGKVPGLRTRDPESDESGRGVAARWSRLVTRRPVPVLLVTAIGMIALAIPALDLRLGLPDEGSMGTETTQRQAYDLLADGFGAGFNGPLLLVVDTSDAADPAAAAERVTELVTGVNNVALATPANLNPAGDTGVVTVIPVEGPSAATTEDLVGDIRDLSTQLEVETGATLAVTGMTAIIIDFNERMASSLLPYLSLVVGLSFLLLILVFRSILVPLKAALGFLLTMGATFGITVGVFQWGWLSGLLAVEQTGIILSMLPIFLIGVVFGLAMDYQVFMVTRMREEYVHGAAPIPAIVTGFRHGSRVVTAAAIIMISVFAGFALSGDDFIMQVAFALAVAIALDAFVVRMTLVPATLALLGRSAWWLPGWLNRILPNVDIEGEKLQHTLDASREPVSSRS